MATQNEPKNQEFKRGAPKETIDTNYRHKWRNNHQANEDAHQDILHSEYFHKTPENMPLIGSGEQVEMLLQK